MDKKTFTWEDYNHKVAELARQITIGQWRPDYIVGLTRGGLTAAVMLSHYFNVPMHSLGVSLRDDNGFGPESNLWMAEDAFGYVNKEEREHEHIPYDLTKAKNILIVDDINDTGATLNWIMDDWESGCLPADERWDHVWNNNVRFAVVVDNTASKAKVTMDYWAHVVNKAENDVWIEFPYETWWRV
jgi:hypoxanthine phosphoribosyltransferase